MSEPAPATAQAESSTFKPYVPADSKMREISFVAIATGMVLSVVLGAANAYLGLKAGLTVAATFPAAVIAMAVLRMTKGTILEENVCRTTAAVGEALAAGAIFTVPAFLISGAWTGLKYTETTLLLLLGGVLGVLFVIFLRRVLIEDTSLPFPESVACAEIVKAGQGGQTGAAYVFGALGLSALLQFIKADQGLKLFSESWAIFVPFMKSKAQLLVGGKVLGDATAHQGGVYIQSPVASPALMSVGYIIGPKYASINFAGGVLAWLVFIPLALFLNPNLMAELSMGGVAPSWQDLAYSCWYNEVRPFAVGAMLLAAFYTLYGLRDSLGSSIKGIFSKHEHAAGQSGRLERDLNLKGIMLVAACLLIPMGFIYYHFCHSAIGAIASAIILGIIGFLFAAVGGWLVGIVGNSNQPLSGLTLAALVISALLMLLLGLKGVAGVGAVLGIAAVVCAAASMSGDIIQDLKVGQLIGGTPWKMELAGIIAVIVMAFLLVFPLVILHEGNIMAGGIGIGDAKLPAPQAGLMAQLASGIIGGQMPWGLIVMGMCFTLALILVKAPSPMLIAVGMYLPFETTFAIFVGGVFKWIFDRIVERRKWDQKEKEAGENKGILLASGFIAGEAVTGVFLAALVLLGVPSITQAITGQEELAIYGQAGGWLSLIVFAVVAIALIGLPIRKAATK